MLSGHPDLGEEFTKVQVFVFLSKYFVPIKTCIFCKQIQSHLDFTQNNEIKSNHQRFS